MDFDSAQDLAALPPLSSLICFTGGLGLAQEVFLACPHHSSFAVFLFYLAFCCVFWCNSFLYNSIFSFQLLATVDLKVLNEIDLNVCLRCCALPNPSSRLWTMRSWHRWNTLCSRIAINPRQFICDMTLIGATCVSVMKYVTQSLVLIYISWHISKTSLKAALSESVSSARRGGLWLTRVQHWWFTL